MDDALAAVRDWVAGARPRSIVVLTGAGISTDSGIPDFRGPDGVWTRDPAAERASTLDAYLGDPDLRRLAWQRRLVHPAWTAAPNAAHLALVELERRDVLHTLVTQNIDGLHQAAGHDPDRVVEVHGTMRRVTCWSCGATAPMAGALDRVRAGEADPACRDCGGILKSDTILFGQPLVAATVHRADAAARACDLLLAAGTSLAVYPVAGMVPVARRSGARVVIVNGAPTDLDHHADAVLRGPIGELLPAIVGTTAAPLITASEDLPSIDC
jgi:NAD-dependent deacetylase